MCRTLVILNFPDFQYGIISSVQYGQCHEYVRGRGNSSVSRRWTDLSDSYVHCINRSFQIISTARNDLQWTVVYRVPNVQGQFLYQPCLHCHCIKWTKHQLLRKFLTLHFFAFLLYLMVQLTGKLMSLQCPEFWECSMSRKKILQWEAWVIMAQTGVIL